MLARAPSSVLSAKLAPAINLEGHKFSDDKVVDDIALLMLIVDKLHEARVPIKHTEMFDRLKEYGIESLEFFRMKYRAEFEVWLTRFPHHLQLLNKQLSLTTYAHKPQPPPVIGKKKRQALWYNLGKQIETTGTPPNISQFIELCKSVAKVDLPHLHVDLKLQPNPSFVIQWLLPNEVEIRRTATGSKVVLPIAPKSVADELDSDTLDSLSSPLIEPIQEIVVEALSYPTVSTSHDTVTKLPPYNDSRVFMESSGSPEDTELKLVLLCLSSEARTKIVDVLQYHPGQLHLIILDQGRDILLRFVDGTQVHVKDSQMTAGDITDCLPRAARLYSTEPTTRNNYASTGGHLRLNHQMLSDAEVSTAAEGYNITFRIARYITSEPTLISDLVASASGELPKSFLILGAQGSGKTTLLCQIARQLSLNKSKNIRLVDRNNEMGGENGMHPRIGFARPERSSGSFSERVRDAVKKHHANVLIVDELSNRDELAAVVDAVKRGVPVVASVSGQCPTLQGLTNDDELGQLVANPSRCVFDAVVEIRKVNHVHVYHDVRSAVTSMREGRECSFEKRKASKTSSSRPVLAPRRKDSNSNSNSNEFELSAATLLQMRLSEQVTLDQRLTPVKKDIFRPQFNNM